MYPNLWGAMKKMQCTAEGNVEKELTPERSIQEEIVKLRNEINKM